MAENERTEQKVGSHEDCCGGHCENDAQSAQNGESELESEVENSSESGLEATESAPEKDWKVQAAYLAAEIQNMQKRFQRDASDIRKYANEDILKRIVPVLDTLTLALSAADKAKTLPENEALFNHKLLQSLLQGVEMTAKQFEQVLQSSGVEFVETEGKTFDPSLHEALGQTNKVDVPDNSVTEVFQRGFKLGGRVIRPAKVMVNKV